MPIKVRISGFKSIGHVEMEPAPLTVLIGPPASGKSNILDALALLGYLSRHFLVDSEYKGQPSLIEPASLLARFKNYQEIFRLQDLSKTVKVVVNLDGSDVVDVEMYYTQGVLRVKLNGVEAPANIDPLRSGSSQGDNAAIAGWVKSSLKSRFDVRVYGYERYGLSTSVCTNEVVCNFYSRLKGSNPKPAPVSVLSELAWNVTRMLKSIPWVVPEVNDAVREHFGERVELKVLRNGTVAVFDYDYEIDIASLSDGILRPLYYLLALASAVNYAKLRGLEGKLIVGLEEPESHVFPFMMNLIAKYIADAARYAVVIVSTHNPIFASMLGDKVENARFYYVFRGKHGSTSVLEIDVQALARDLKTIEDVMMMSPSDVTKSIAKG